MTVPVLVSDLEFAATCSLHLLDKPGHRRVAYFAGLLSGLRIARIYSEKEIQDPDPMFWMILEGDDVTHLTLGGFVQILTRYTNPRFVVSLSQMADSGLRLGKPGVYYSLGVADATKIAIRQVPLQYRLLQGDDWKKPTLEWIDQKIQWAETNLRLEKAKCNFR
jgi:hypothetical protein